MCLVVFIEGPDILHRKQIHGQYIICLALDMHSPSLDFSGVIFEGEELWLGYAQCCTHCVCFPNTSSVASPFSRACFATRMFSSASSKIEVLHA